MIQAHLLPVLLAAAAAFLAGGLWYGVLFGRLWQAALGWGEAEKTRARASMARTSALTFGLELLSAFFLGHLLAHVAHGARFTMMIATGMALGFVGPATAMNALYELKPWRLIAIDVGHWVVVYAVMGAVFVLLGV